jgi:hypothetical protein
MIASSKVLIAAGLLASACVLHVSRVAAADVEDGSQTIAVHHARTAKPASLGTTQFSGWPGEVRNCVGCHETR